MSHLLLVDSCQIFQLSVLQSQILFSTLHMTEVENTEAWIDPKTVHLAFCKTKHQHACMFNTLYTYISWNYLSWSGKKSLLLFRQHLILWTAGFVLQRKDTNNHHIWKEELEWCAQNNKFVCTIPGFYGHKINSNTTENLDHNLPITAERPCLQELFMAAWLAKS